MSRQISAADFRDLQTVSVPLDRRFVGILREPDADLPPISRPPPEAIAAAI